jgi:hypothetical protein
VFASGPPADALPSNKRSEIGITNYALSYVESVYRQDEQPPDNTTSSGFQLNLQAVFSVEVDFSSLNRGRFDDTFMRVLVVRDRLGSESYWFPAQIFCELCGFEKDWSEVMVNGSCLPSASYAELVARFGFQDYFDNKIAFIDQETVNYICYNYDFCKFRFEVDSMRCWVNQFYRTRRFMVGEAIKRMVDDYVELSASSAVSQ